MKILDCTLRDGGYYTDWDFSEKISSIYFKETNNLPLDYLEIGYRSPLLSGYQGKYFYLPEKTISEISSVSSKKLAIILNEKDLPDCHIENLLKPCFGKIHLIRLAVDPKNISRALKCAAQIKNLGFEVAMNIMYLSKWEEDPNLFHELEGIDQFIDYLYMVDSYGGIYPEDINRIVNRLKSITNVSLGFHGHNNLELALANTIIAIKSGVEIIDCTFTGMGRGAGNLKTELFLTYLEKQNNLVVDFDALDKVTSSFEKLQNEYKWGTNLAYMVSGANSIPQKEVMEWVTKRFFSYNSIIRAIKNKKRGVSDNENNIKQLDTEKQQTFLVIGGGISVKKNLDDIVTFLNDNPKIILLHVSSRNAGLFKNIQNQQFFCLSGNEGVRLDEIYSNDQPINALGILPPYPREMGTFIPQTLRGSCRELVNLEPLGSYPNSLTALALKIVIDSGKKNHFIIGFDGYSSRKISEKENELFLENNLIFESVQRNVNLHSLTKTKYDYLIQDSIFKHIS